MLSNFLWKIKGKSAQGDGKKKLVYLGCATGCIFNIYLHKNIYINTKKKHIYIRKFTKQKFHKVSASGCRLLKMDFLAVGWAFIPSFIHSLTALSRSGLWCLSQEHYVQGRIKRVKPQYSTAYMFLYCVKVKIISNLCYKWDISFVMCSIWALALLLNIIFPYW